VLLFRDAGELGHIDNRTKQRREPAVAVFATMQSPNLVGEIELFANRAVNAKAACA
jgi:hypothetical protein